MKSREVPDISPGGLGGRALPAAGRLPTFCEELSERLLRLLCGYSRPQLLEALTLDPKRVQRCRLRKQEDQKLVERDAFLVSSFGESVAQGVG
jgi:hypothetical protein